MSEQNPIPSFTHIEIIDIPPGFPPDSVRKQWVGLVIPLADPLAPHPKGLVVDVKTGEVITAESFVVNTEDAIKALRGKSEEAYQWFIDNRIPDFFPQISFQAAYCKLVFG